MIYLELFPASQGAQLQKITVNTFSIQLGQILNYNPRSDRKKRTIPDRDDFVG